MDYLDFMKRLPSVYQDWGRPTVQAKCDRFQQLLQRVRGLTAPNVLQLLNRAVGCLEDGEVYCEIGCFHGATLIGALLDNPRCSALAVDNFSEFDPYGGNYQVLLANLTAFGLQSQVQFHNRDFQGFFLNLRGRGTKVGVYFYDGAHDYRSQLLALLLAVPVLADQSLIVLDDSNWPAVKQATWDFMAVRPECRLLFELSTPGNCHSTFWNGLYVLGWDVNGKNAYDEDTLRRTRQTSLLESLNALQQVSLKIEGNQVRVTQTI